MLRTSGSGLNLSKALGLLVLASVPGLPLPSAAQPVQVRRENDLTCQMVRQDGRRVDLGKLCTPGQTGSTAGIVRQSRSCPMPTAQPALRLNTAARVSSREQLVARNAQAVVTVESGLPFNTGMLNVNLDPKEEMVITHQGTIGSGFIIDPRGFVLTSARTVGADCQLFVRLTSGQRLPARVVRVSYESDVALLQIMGNPGRFTALSLQPGAANPTGTSVMAISGNPETLIRNDFASFNTRGMARRVTSGIISGKLESGALHTNLPTRSGDTGAPVLNEQGQVIGMVLSEYNPLGNLEVPKNADPQAIAILMRYSRNIYVTEVLPIQAALRALGVR